MRHALAASNNEAEGTAGARGAFEFFATSVRHEPPQQPTAKKSCDETTADPEPAHRGGGDGTRMVVGSGEPNAAPPGIRSGIHACALSRLLTLAFQAAFAAQRRRISTGLTLTKEA